MTQHFSWCLQHLKWTKFICGKWTCLESKRCDHAGIISQCLTSYHSDKQRQEPGSRCLQPTKQSSDKFSQFWERMSKSSFIIQGVTLWSFSFFKYGIVCINVFRDMSPKQKHSTRTFKHLRDTMMSIMILSDKSCLTVLAAIRCPQETTYWMDYVTLYLSKGQHNFS